MSHEPGSRGWITQQVQCKLSSVIDTSLAELNWPRQIGMVKVDVNNYKHAVAEENWKEADAAAHRVVFRAENITKYWPQYADRFRVSQHSCVVLHKRKN